VQIARQRCAGIAAAHEKGVLLFVDNIMSDTPLTTNLAEWWSTPMIAALVLSGVVAWFAYSAARTGQPLFGQVLED
jgi:hypothetical protein